MAVMKLQRAKIRSTILLMAVKTFDMQTTCILGLNVVCPRPSAWHRIWLQRRSVVGGVSRGGVLAYVWPGAVAAAAWRHGVTERMILMAVKLRGHIQRNDVRYNDSGVWWPAVDIPYDMIKVFLIMHDDIPMPLTRRYDNIKPFCVWCSCCHACLADVIKTIRDEEEEKKKKKKRQLNIQYYWNAPWRRLCRVINADKQWWRLYSSWS